ncbi:alpha/beta fold hydrolase [Saccharopolyspora sp. NPDC050389]|uniref:alpha/beta fold hydrolase n=1 Tax=Saccharopolyspora sp. NPDC050389 TaxID=3155516 RepID=UPI0033EFBA2D
MPEHFTVADGAQLAYRIVGDGAENIVLVHSLALDGSWFEPLAEQMGPEFRCVIPDARGHGGSEGLPDQISLRRLADDIAELLDHLELPKASVLGISLGGMIAQAFAARHPQRVDKVVLIATAGSFNDAAREGNAARAQAALSPNGIAAMADATLGRWFGDQPQHDESISALAARAREQYLGSDPQVHAATLLSMTAVGDFQVPPDLPTLVIGGQEDVSTPRTVVEQLAADIPQARLAFVPGGHLTAFTHPTPVAAMLTEFLAQRDPEVAN